MQATRRRWSDNDKVKGPFLVSKNTHYNPWTVILNSGHGDYPGCHLRVSAFGYTVILELPAIIKPWRRWVDLSQHEWATSPQKGYWDEHANEYGFSISDGSLHVYYGPQTHDSLTTKSFCKFIPWQQWRFVRQSWYGPAGQHIETLWKADARDVRRAQMDWRDEFEKTLAKTSFQIKDYDGALIVCDTNIEEREWRFGEGLFKWLSWFRKPMVRRVLNLSFRKEVGTEKGSWKGGLMGSSIEMEPGELHESALRRYCEQEHRAKYGKYFITFMGAAT